MAYIRQDMADIRVSVGGKSYPLSWAEVEGGLGLESDDSKTRPGGMGSEVSVGGPSSRDDVQVRTQFTDVVAGWDKEFEAAVQRDDRMSVRLAFLGPNKVPNGRTKTLVGIIKANTPPDFASDEGEVGMYELTMSADENSA
jgi:hypothetical protein